ncbi:MULTISPECIES: peroxiredoxin [unclassified Actinomyces]|uniref:peroxiredoxin n=1 Tax=unclassified Actinomyces TaxID=2609248 RepID=UPI0020178E8A|nr:MULTISPECIES: peroxiredoxin [unclassified Actinomyces]MCL3776751.1 peroxiredoxin [Actinomyces sp. AC-20-1]MCL3789705.1 peroxiredoxin [Actinomyces sp. 187325]MCL3791890.1 peroxiredoxin [Actinomyces sp. 186855]MCL3794449.1 peroxiredoxin [Actinomyces sp. 217892]
MPRLAVGDTAPDFTLTDASGAKVRLAALREAADRGVVVYFYPRASTPGCTKEACDFRDSLASWRDAGYEVVGVSPDPQAALARFAENESLPFPLLSDPDHAVMEAWGAWGAKKSYGRVLTGVIRSTVVVDRSGTVTLARYNVKATGHVERLRSELAVG